MKFPKSTVKDRSSTSFTVNFFKKNVSLIYGSFQFSNINKKGDILLEIHILEKLNFDHLCIKRLRSGGNNVGEAVFQRLEHCLEKLFCSHKIIGQKLNRYPYRDTGTEDPPSPPSSNQSFTPDSDVTQDKIRYLNKKFTLTKLSSLKIAMPICF